MHPGCCLALTATLKEGSLCQEESARPLSNIEAHMQEMQSVLLNEQAKTAGVDHNLKGGSGYETTGLFAAIRKGQVRDVVPKKFNAIQLSGAFQPWTRAVAEFACWHDPANHSLIEYVKSSWTVDARLTSQAVAEHCNNKEVDTEPDQGLHMVMKRMSSPRQPRSWTTAGGDRSTPIWNICGC